MWDETSIGRAARGRSSINTQQSSKASVLQSSALPAAIIAVASVAIADTASAAEFTQANLQGAKNACATGATGALAVNCAAVNAGTSSASIGSFLPPGSSLTSRGRLGTARQSEGGGASSDEVVSLGEGLSVFASAGAEALTHSNNEYEDGYKSAVPSVTVGADYQVTPWLVAGLAFNYFNFNGDYDDGGQFNTNSFGPIAYASFLPFDGAFADVTLGYARKDYFRNRRARISNATGESLLSGIKSGGNGANEYSTALLLGYDYPIKNFTIGPRIGLNYIATQINDYREHGQTGLELRYSGQDTSTLQSSLGAVATAAMSTQFGVLLPQVSASWVHDYAVGGRNIDASFVDATGPSKFSFKREEQAPNYAIIGVGVSALLPNKLQPFVNFKTIQGNEYLVSYGGTAGLRVGL